MQDSIVLLKSDMDVIYERTGGRLTGGEKPEPFITMSQCQVHPSRSISDKKQQEALLSQGRPRDAGVNFGMYRSLQRHRVVFTAIATLSN